MSRRKILRVGVAAYAVGITASAAAQPTQQPQVQQLERVEVTGSNIKRINAETTAPVEVITREQILRSGQPTVADLLRQLSSNGGGSFGESFSNSFAPGAAGISLRGLGQKTTLVLLNGRRVAGYGFAQNLQETFVDLNSIPSSAVQRVDILKDGASAIYGSDAIAGVVNIILRRDFTGVEINAGTAISSKSDRTLNIIGGLGDLAVDKFNIFGVLDYYKREELLLSDTDFGETRDMRRFAGGRNAIGLTSGGGWRQLSATNALTNNFAAISGCSGSLLNGVQATDAGLLDPRTATGQNQGIASNTFCALDLNKYISALPATERIGFITRSLYEFSPEVTAFGELGLNRNTTEQTFSNPSFAGSTGLVPIPGGLQPFTYNVNFAPGVAGNPFASNARYVGALNDIGSRNSEITSDTVRALAGLRYSIDSWDLESAIGLSKNTADSLSLNRLSLSGTSAVFGVPATRQPPVPTSIAATYNLDNPASNSAAVRNQLRADFTRSAESKLSFIDTKGSTEIQALQLPGGAVSVAVGVEYRKEKLADRPAAQAARGDVLGQGVTATDGERSSTALYAEFALPITKQIDAQLAVRQDRYSDYGSSTIPKVGLKYAPSSEIAFRANWGKGFRAPTLPEISKSTATFFATVIDPEDEVQRQISGLIIGNPSLKAETSTSATIGFILEPSKMFNISVDAYRIDWRDVVAAPDFQDLLDDSCPPPEERGEPPSRCPSVDGVISRDPDTNFVNIIQSAYKNLENRKTKGLDIDGRLSLPAGDWGQFKIRGNLVYIRSFKENGVDYAGSNGGENAIPRIKASIALDWDSGPWSTSYTSRYTHSYRQESLAPSFFAQQDPRFQNGIYPERVPSYSTYDAFVRYELSKKLSISASVVNLFNRMPPYDPSSATYLYDFTLYDVRGRQARVNLKYSM